VLGNPLKYTDPTGHKECAETDGNGNCLTGIQVLKRYIQSKYKKVKFKGKLDDDNLLDIYTGLTETKYKGFHGNTGAFNAAFGSLTFTAHHFSGDTAGDATWQTGEIRLDPEKSGWTTVVHEMGHLFSAALKRKNERVPSYRAMYLNVFDAGPGATGYGQTNSWEDFADSFLMVIEYGPQTKKISKERIEVITALMQSYTNSDHTLSPGR
jgi:hypothetical protein